MYRFSYAQAVEDSSNECRRREYDLFDRAIAMLKAAEKAEVGSPDLINAVAFVQRVWTFLIQDLGSPGNGLPDNLKGEIISIGIWVIKETTLIVRGESSNVAGVIEVNSMIRDGLK
ncbi:flagellar biosynthesis regulator FlaF [Microvirga sp. 2TAF3]|uniref:flagellar biosynthesis regulator FlaF n=1 Tax=Microvirga sp. 2TAF3 TaxID=3233014 RepID=UPI003F9DDE9C